MKRLMVWLAPLVLIAAPCCAQSAPASLAAGLERLTEKGNGAAAYHLGMLYHLGLEGRPKDSRKAFELFRLAAERGDALGAYKVGCYYAGQGGSAVPVDPALALRYTRVAAEAGYALAQQEVGEMYLEAGEVTAALKWLEAAARQDDLRALARLAAAYSGKIPLPGVEADPARAYLYDALLLRQIARLDGTRGAAAQAAHPRETPAAVRERGERLLAQWRVERTPLTLRAGKGLDDARALLAARRGS